MKRHFLLDEYSFINGQINITLIFDDDFYLDEIIDESIFEKYIEESGKLEYFEDRWDAYKESHYTEEYIMAYDKWRDEYCEKDDILEFLYYYYENNKLPEVITE